MSASDFFLGRQPILNRKHTIAAYELLFRRSSGNSADVLDDLHATSSVIINAFSDMNLEAVLAGKPGFINVSEELLMSDLIEFLPKHMVVLELLESIRITPEIVARCIALKKAGFSLALDDVLDFSDSYIPLLQHAVSIVKFDLKLIAADQWPAVIAPFRNFPVKLLAEKVDSQADADTCMQLGFDLFQGYYYAKPVILASKRADPNKLSLLRLLGLIIGDADTAQIETIFRTNPNLTYSLLRLVNSAACGLPTPIHSVHQAIVILGRKQLMRWLQLLLFASHDQQSEYPSPLMQLAAHRGRFMELLAREIPDCNTDEAFMAGILSLLDSLMGIPLGDILQELNLDTKVKNALIDQTGELGTLLKLIKSLEQADFSGTEATMQNLPTLTPEILNKAEMETSIWVRELENNAP